MDESGSSVTIGGAGNGSWLYDGNIADVMMFNKALTDGEIKYLYNDGCSDTSSSCRPMELRITWPLPDFEGFACWLKCPEQYHDHDGHNQLFDLDVFDKF